ncbi:MAG: hypothetical protein M1834_004619 [Cirrosporium novae-zelandiae]|nr:MAG: hypothetical protein M1834_004619 [Cirrosporium novae-zelandiae]
MRVRRPKLRASLLAILQFWSLTHAHNHHDNNNNNDHNNNNNNNDGQYSTLVLTIGQGLGQGSGGTGISTSAAIAASSSSANLIAHTAADGRSITTFTEVSFQTTTELRISTLMQTIVQTTTVFQGFLTVSGNCTATATNRVTVTATDNPSIVTAGQTSFATIVSPASASSNNSSVVVAIVPASSTVQVAQTSLAVSSAAASAASIASSSSSSGLPACDVCACLCQQSLFDNGDLGVTIGSNISTTSTAAKRVSQASLSTLQTITASPSTFDISTFDLQSTLTLRLGGRDVLRQTGGPG